MAYPKERFSFWVYKYSFPFGPHVLATTLPGFGIIYRYQESEVAWSTRRHECEHVAQFRRMGGGWAAVVAFYVIYFWEYGRALIANKWNAAVAYMAIPMEIQAYAQQVNLTWPPECPDHPAILPGPGGIDSQPIPDPGAQT